MSRVLKVLVSEIIASALIAYVNEQILERHRLPLQKWTLHLIFKMQDALNCLNTTFLMDLQPQMKSKEEESQLYNCT